MLIACWSPKGGSGTSTAVATLAAAALRRRRNVRLLDATGDQAALLAVGAAGPGLHDWLAGGADAPLDAIDRLAVALQPRGTLVPAGRRSATPAPADAGSLLAEHLARDAAITIADLGHADEPALGALARHADVGIVVARACFLTLARVAADSLTETATGIVLIRDRGRSLRARDVEAIAARPVLLDVRVRPALARLADAGTLLHAANEALLAPWRELLTTLVRERDMPRSRALANASGRRR